METVALKCLTIFCPLLLQKSSRRSKNRENVEHLKRRFDLWNDGDINSLLREGKAIQARLTKTKRNEQDIHAVFSRLMLQGKVGAAIRWVTENKSVPLKINEDVIKQLKEKHPECTDATEGTLIYGPVNKVESAIYDSIDGVAIERAAKMMKGGAGPSGLTRILGG